jgi:hypothetical protein
MNTPKKWSSDELKILDRMNRKRMTLSQLCEAFRTTEDQIGLGIDEINRKGQVQQPKAETSGALPEGAKEIPIDSDFMQEVMLDICETHNKLGQQVMGLAQVAAMNATEGEIIHTAEKVTEFWKQMVEPKMALQLIIVQVLYKNFIFVRRPVAVPAPAKEEEKK